MEMKYLSQRLGSVMGRRHAFAAMPLAAVALMTMGGSAANAATAGTAKSKPVIAFSQSFSSNSWQQLNDKSAQQVANTLKKQGKISKYVFVNANNSVSTQISQIDSLILQHVDAIIVDPTSTSGLNGAINKAVAAGIKVLVITDGPVTTNEPYELETSLYGYTNSLAKFIVQQLHGKGNVLDVRGVAGTGADKVEEAGSAAVFSKYPGYQDRRHGLRQLGRGNRRVCSGLGATEPADRQRRHAAGRLGVRDRRSVPERRTHGAADRDGQPFRGADLVGAAESEERLQEPFGEPEPRHGRGCHVALV